MEIQVTFPMGQRVDATFGTHVVHTDQPVERGGAGSAPTPYEIFLAALATCAGSYVLNFCLARDISTDGITLVQRDEPGTIAIEICLPASFPEKYLASIQRAAESCKVKKTISAQPSIVVTATQLPEPSLEISA